MDLTKAWKARLEAHQESKLYYDIYQSHETERKQLLARWKDTSCSCIQRELDLVKADLCLIQQHEAYAKYGRIRVEADQLWLTHVQDICGDIDLEWKHRDNPADPYGPPFLDCYLSTGEFFEETCLVSNTNPVYLKLTWRQFLKLQEKARNLRNEAQAVKEKYKHIPDDQQHLYPDIKQAHIWWYQAHDIVDEAHDLWSKAVKQVYGSSPIHWIKNDNTTFDCRVADETFCSNALEPTALSDLRYNL